MSIFSKIPVKKPKLVPHDLSATIDFSTQFGRLTPLKMEKVIPGDIIPIGVLHQEQFAPLASKLYQDYRIKTESFFVPSRILWDNFGKFFVAEDNTYLHPTFTPADVFLHFAARICSKYPAITFDPNNTTTTKAAKLKLMNRLFWQLFGPSSCFHFLFGSVYGDSELVGFDNFFSSYPLVKTSDKDNSYYIDPDYIDTFPNFWKQFDTLRWVAYYRVLCEYYLDENLQHDLMEFVVDNQLTSGEDIAAIIVRYVVQFLPIDSGAAFGSVIEPVFMKFINLFHGFFHRCWPKDYFAGALPFKQQGNAVEIPLSGNGTLELQLSDASSLLLANNTLINNLNVVVAADQSGVQSGFKRVYLQYQNSDGGVSGGATTTEPLQSNVTVGGIHTTIEDFRTAYQLQEWLEKNARGGTRYKEQIFSHFGIKTKDSRLDRPEFIVGSTDAVNYGNVFTTFQNSDGDGVPAESVTAISAGGRSRSGVYRVTEHGYIFTIHSVYPTPSYALGLFRQGFELDKFDYFWPEFQHLGEQEVYKCELNGNNDDSVFGYQPRYAQYKTRSRQVHGDFIDSLPTFTSFRHVAGTANLNPSFITILSQYSNLDRVFNYLATDYDKIYCSVRINSPALRPIDYYGVPRLFN